VALIMPIEVVWDMLAASEKITRTDATCPRVWRTLGRKVVKDKRFHRLLFHNDQVSTCALKCGQHFGYGTFSGLRLERKRKSNQRRQEDSAPTSRDMLWIQKGKCVLRALSIHNKKIVSARKSHTIYF